jgi:glucose-6-phosphate 1-dehydrogenase
MSTDGFATGLGCPPCQGRLIAHAISSSCRFGTSTGLRLLVDAQRGGDTEPEQINLHMEFAQQGGEGPTPYEVLLHAAMIGDSRRFTRQDNIEETWRIMAPLIDNPPRIHPYKTGSWGPKAADRLVADYDGWHGPWLES